MNNDLQSMCEGCEKEKKLSGYRICGKCKQNIENHDAIIIKEMKDRGMISEAQMINMIAQSKSVYKEKMS